MTVLEIADIRVMPENSAAFEAHTVDFRASEAFTAWRGLVGQYFAAPPHVERVLEGF